MCWKKHTGRLDGKGGNSGQQYQKKDKKKDTKDKKAAKAAKVKSAPPTPQPSDTEDSDSEESNVSAAAVLKHRLFVVTTKTNRVSDDTFVNPTPRLDLVVTPSGKGTPFRFRALPDTGCTTTVISRDLQKSNGISLHRTKEKLLAADDSEFCLLYTSPSPRDKRQSRMPSSA